MKKTLALILAAALMFSVLAFAGCSDDKDKDAPAGNQNGAQSGNQTPDPNPVTPDPNPAPHTHTWDAGTVTKAPTCNAAGEKTFTCSCGEKKTESVAKLTEHTFDGGVVSGSTKTYTCTVCGEKKTETVTPDIPNPEPHTHAWTGMKVTQAATCGKEGIVELSCDCGEKKTESVAKLTEHTFDGGVVSGSTKTYTCTVCGEQKTETVPQGDHEHTWGTPNIIKEATCGEEGQATLSCACGITATVTIPATGKHNLNSLGICTVCGDIGIVATPSDIG